MISNEVSFVLVPWIVSLIIVNFFKESATVTSYWTAKITNYSNRLLKQLDIRRTVSSVLLSMHSSSVDFAWTTAIRYLQGYPRNAYHPLIRI